MENEFGSLNTLNRSDGPKQLMHRPRLQRLKDAKRGLEVKLAEVNRAIELLEANPEVYELMEAIEKAGF